MTSTDEIWGAKSAAPYLKSVDCSFDEEEPWRSWETEISRNMIEQRAQNIEGCKGRLTGLEVTGKSESGAVTRLRVHTEGGDGEVQSNMNLFVSCSGSENFRRERKREEKWRQPLPSAYFTIEETEKGFLIRGGGYGHGVGISQTAAGKMAEEGYTWEEILMYFFREIEISQTW